MPVLLLVSLPALAKEDVLHLYNWNDYIAPETVERFEKACSCKVKQSYFSDNEELHGQAERRRQGLRRHGADLELRRWAWPRRAGCSRSTTAKVPNLKNIMPQYLNTEFDPGNKYSVPYAMSITLIGYNEQKMKELGIPVDSWAIDLRSQDPGEDQGPGHRAGQPERADGGRAQVSRATR